MVPKLSERRITSCGIHHLVEGAEHDKDPKIKEVLNPLGFSVLELTNLDFDKSNYDIWLRHLDHNLGLQKFQLPEDINPHSFDALGVMQYFLENEKAYFANAVFSTSVNNNPQVSGNMYKEK